GRPCSTRPFRSSRHLPASSSPISRRSASSLRPERMPAVPRHVVIIGGGITGLTAAYALNDNARRHPSFTCTLVEASPRLGGKILTERSNGFVIEAGPESFLAQKPWGIDLCRRLGLSLIPTNPEHRKTFVLLGGRLHELPQGLVMGVPAKLGPFLRTSLLSWPGKLR